MAETNQGIANALNPLYRIVDAGERGFATVAAGTNNQALKLLFKSYAQQRYLFKEEIRELIKASGGKVTSQTSLPGIVHRGRVAIFTAMIIEDDRRERVALKEAALGERYALKTYRKTLEKDLPAGVRQVLERQLAEVEKAAETVNALRGTSQERRVVRVYSSMTVANQAVKALDSAGFRQDDIVKFVLDPSIYHYQGRGATVSETVLSGMVGGVVWATLIGILAGIGAVQTTALGEMGISSSWGTFLLVAGMTILMGALVGGLLGLVIGLGTSEEDRIDYRQSLLPGSVVLSGTFEAARAKEAEKLMDQVKAHSQEPAAQTAQPTM